MPSRDQSDYIRRLKYRTIVSSGGPGNIRNRYTDISSVVAMGSIAGNCFTGSISNSPEINLNCIRYVDSHENVKSLQMNSIDDIDVSLNSNKSLIHEDINIVHHEPLNIVSLQSARYCDVSSNDLKEMYNKPAVFCDVSSNIAKEMYNEPAVFCDVSSNDLKEMYNEQMVDCDISDNVIIISSVLPSENEEDIYKTVESTTAILGQPDVPTIISVTPGNQQLRIDYIAPTNTGSSDITDYECSIDGITYKSIGSTANPGVVIINKLANNTPYTVYIRAVNSSGPGSVTVRPPLLNDTTPIATTNTYTEEATYIFDGTNQYVKYANKWQSL
jgi:hypothetical protein